MCALLLECVELLGARDLPRPGLSSRIEWSVLLRRTFGFDSLHCPKCHARMRILATVTDPGTMNKILTHLGVRTEPLPRARARDPTGQESFHVGAA